MQISKISFQVYRCTGSDPEFPVEDITKHGPFATGWQSERFCTFPQLIILKLHGNPRVFKIQLLLHHYKIPTKIDVGIGNSVDSIDRLGYVSLGDNLKNSFRARELKTVHIDARCKYIQLVFYRCHVNALNLYNQVGLVALNILGVEETLNPLKSDQGDPIVRGMIERSFVDQHTLPDQDLLLVDHDRFIVRAVSQISISKKEAVENEDYVLAKQIKVLEELLSKASVEISVLQAKKKEASSTEDYDRAQMYHSEIQQIKRNLDEKLKDAGIVLSTEDNLSLSFRSSNKEKQSSSTMKIESKIPSRPTSSSGRDPSTPASLNEQELKEYALAIQIFGEKTVACILSPYFNLRETGLKQTIDSLSGNTTSNPEDVVKAAFQLVLFAANDIREKSNALYIQLYQTLIEFSEIKNVSGQVVLPLVAQSLPSLLNKTADLNPRIRQKAVEMVQFLGHRYHKEPSSIMPLLLKSMGSKVSSIPAKHAKSRLEIINQMINDYGFEEENDSTNGWSSNNVIVFTQQFLNHTNVEVRDIASTVLANVAMIKGSDSVLDSVSAEKVQTVQKKISSLNDVRGPSKPQSPVVKKRPSSSKIKADTNSAKKTAPKKEIGSPKSETKKEPNHSRRSTTESDPFQQTCIFCGYEDETFDEETIDLHYWKDCPALTICKHCKMLVEITEMNQHLTLDCDLADEFMSCPKCKMAVNRNELASHKQGPLCRPQHYPDTIRCPLCWQDFKGAAGIKNHFIYKPGCPESQRKPLKDRKPTKFFRFKE